MSLKQNKIYALVGKKAENPSAFGMFGALVDETIADSKVTKKVLNQLGADDTLLVPNVLALGKTVSEVVETLEVLAKAKINLCFVAENLSFKAEKLPEIADLLLMTFKLHKSLISLRSKSALQERKANGKKLGRPFGSESAMELDAHKDDILGMMKSGISKGDIAKKYNVCRTTIYNFAKRMGVL